MRSVQVLTNEEIKTKKFSHCYAGCMIVNSQGHLLLQQRDKDAKTFAGMIGTFGGRLEANETPLKAIQRELDEELGIRPPDQELIFLGALTEACTNFQDLVYEFCWQDSQNQVQQSFEGELVVFKDHNQLLESPNLLDDIPWLVAQCIEQGLLGDKSND